MHHRKKNEETTRHPPKIPGIKTAKKRVLITKIKTTKENASHLGKELPMSLVNFTKNFYEDNEKDDSEHEVNDDDKYSNTDVHINDTEETTGIPEITTEELQTAINKLKKRQIPGQQRNPS